MRIHASVVRCLPVFSPDLYPEESKDEQSKSQQAAHDARVRPPVIDGPLQGQQYAYESGYQEGDTNRIQFPGLLAD